MADLAGKVALKLPVSIILASVFTSGEEIGWRGSLQPQLSRWYEPRWAALLTPWSGRCGTRVIIYLVGVGFPPHLRLLGALASRHGRRPAQRACSRLLAALTGPGTSPVYIESGKGRRCRDIDGNEYIDLVMALGPVLLGYAHDAGESRNSKRSVRVVLP